MAALDTNALVRWLTGDDAAQCAVVERLRDAALSADERLFVPVTVLLELEWVLRARYEFDRNAVTAAMDALLSVDELEIHEQLAAARALWLFKQKGAPDFADCLHIGLAAQAGKEPLLTFDRRAAKLAGAQLLA